MPPESSTWARPAISRIHSRGFFGRQVVEQQPAGAGIQRLAQFFAGADFDFDGQAAGARPLDGVADAARRGDVVVLDQDGVEESHAVVGDAAGGGGHLFQEAQAGRGLARVEHAAFGARHGVGITARRGGHAAEPLEKIQRHALAFEQGAGAAAHRRDRSRLRRTGRHRA